MAKSTWSQLPQQIETLKRKGQLLDEPSSSELNAALDDFEGRSGFRLPKSYREFMKWFGPGALSEWFQVCGPIPPRLRGRVPRVYDIESQREMLLAPDGYWATSVSLEILHRLVLFASTEGGDWFFWDTTDMRNVRDHEYGIYGHRHDSFGGRVVLIAPSFRAFVSEVALSDRYPFTGNDREVEWTFLPAWPNKKRKK